MIPALLTGSLLGAVSGCLLTFALQAWKRRRLPSHETHVTNVFNWTDRPIAKGAPRG